MNKDVDFAEFITDLVNGQVNQKLSEKLSEVTQAVDDTGLTGEVTLKLTIKREGKTATVKADVAGKIPEHPLPGTHMYFGEKGRLHREDPRQEKLKNLDEPRVRAIREEAIDG